MAQPGPTGNASDAPTRPTLSSMIRDTRKALKAIDTQRESLQKQVKDAWDATGKVRSDYWADLSAAFDKFIADGGENNFEKWRKEYATKGALKLEETIERQNQIHANIAAYEEELRALDMQYWTKWHACLDEINGDLPPDERPINPNPPGIQAPPRKAVARSRLSVNPSGPTGIRKKRATVPATASTSRRPASSSTQAGLTSQPRRSARTSLASSPASRAEPTQEADPPNAQTDDEEAVAQDAPREVTDDDTIPSYSPVTNPIPGEVYQAYYHHEASSEKGWYFGTPLPWNGGSWVKDINLDFSMEQMDLLEGFPDCYEPQIVQKEKVDADGNTVVAETITSIKGWAPGFEDGGRKVQDRRFLFLYFDDRPNRPGKLDFPKTSGKKKGRSKKTNIKFSKADLLNVPIDWVGVEHLRPAEVNAAGIRGRATMLKFKTMRKNLAKAADTGASDEVDGETTGVSANSSGMALDDSSASVPQPQADPTAHEDEEMGDADAGTAKDSSEPQGGQQAHYKVQRDERMVNGHGAGMTEAVGSGATAEADAMTTRQLPPVQQGPLRSPFPEQQYVQPLAMQRGPLRSPFQQQQYVPALPMQQGPLRSPFQQQRYVPVPESTARKIDLDENYEHSRDDQSEGHISSPTEPQHHSRQQNVVGSKPSTPGEHPELRGGRQARTSLYSYKMNIDEEYGSLIGTSPTEVSTDDQNKFDEGLGMDYDLGFVKSRSGY